MDPTQHNQVLLSAVLKQRVLVRHFTHVACALLFRDDETRDEQGVGHYGAAEYAAGFEVVARVLGGDGEKCGAQVGREEEAAERIAVLEVGGWLECVFFGVVER